MTLIIEARHFPAKPEKFEFDAEVAEIFDNMAERSIPNYKFIYDRISDIVARLNIPHYSQVWDFGTSTGMGLKAVQRVARHPYIDYFGCDISEPMINKAKDLEWAEFIQCDLTQGFPNPLVRGDVIVAVYGWTLQFIEDFEIRRKLLRDTYEALMPGGVMFVMEKFKDDTKFGQTMQDAYIAWRRDNGYTLSEIKAKNLALRGAMYPWPMPELMKTMIPLGADIGFLSLNFNFAALAFFKPESTDG